MACSPPSLEDNSCSRHGTACSACHYERCLRFPVMTVVKRGWGGGGGARPLPRGGGGDGRGAGGCRVLGRRTNGAATGLHVMGGTCTADPCHSVAPVPQAGLAWPGDNPWQQGNHRPGPRMRWPGSPTCSPDGSTPYTPAASSPFRWWRWGWRWGRVILLVICVIVHDRGGPRWRRWRLHAGQRRRRLHAGQRRRRAWRRRARRRGEGGPWGLRRRALGTEGRLACGRGHGGCAAAAGDGSGVVAELRAFVKQQAGAAGRVGGDAGGTLEEALHECRVGSKAGGDV